jgi:RNA ligase
MESIMTIDFKRIREEIEQGFIREQKHASEDLFIYNYTVKAQFNEHWTTETKMCRGLILDGRQNIVARPFEKFFGYEQLNGEVSLEPFEVYDKLDGSLGILYWIGDTPHIATRGSFDGEQAHKATEILRRKYSRVSFERDRTYLFEIIYPDNRIVLDYGGTEDLFLLAVIDTATGKDMPLENIGIPLVERFDGLHDLDLLQSNQTENKEGYVLKFESGTRVKVKFEEYKRLHKLLTGVNERHIWDELRAGHNLDEIIGRVPDEYYQWVRNVEDKMRAEYAAIEAQCRADFKEIDLKP